ncbi:uncharacterized protein LOC141839885 [Curcuma longa]|uniref:uncharacterized protein LOC141839885 n=1 Tax=Curcuma longa TaxID=136217 RepID=UPI003D9DD010
MESNIVEISTDEETGSREDGRFNSITRFNQIAPTTTRVDAAQLNYRSRTVGSFAGSLATIFFFTHLLAAVILIIYLAARGLPSRHPSFHPAYWFPPLLTSAAASVPFAVLWLLVALHHPTKALRAALWLAPILSCAVAVLLLADDNGVSLAVAVLFLVLALVLSLYCCWITRRLRHAGEVLSAAEAAVRPTLALAKYLGFALLAGVLYFFFWTLGAGGAAASASRFVPLYAILLLLNLAWTMQALRYTVHVAVAQTAYARLASGVEAQPAATIFDTAAARLVLGEVLYGAAVVPAAALARGASQTMGQVVRDSDEFLFSCAVCFEGVAERMVALGNRWGLVYVGAQGKGLGRSSVEVWELFAKQGMERLIELDLTGAFCFLCGVASGSVAAVAAGAWVLVSHKGHVADATAYAFFLGYFMTRIAMAWPQACVAAYHVVFAENPANNEMGSCLRERLRQLNSISMRQIS